MTTGKDVLTEVAKEAVKQVINPAEPQPPTTKTNSAQNAGDGASFVRGDVDSFLTLFKSVQGVSGESMTLIAGFRAKEAEMAAEAEKVKAIEATKREEARAALLFNLSLVAGVAAVVAVVATHRRGESV